MRGYCAIIIISQQDIDQQQTVMMGGGDVIMKQHQGRIETDDICRMMLNAPMELGAEETLKHIIQENAIKFETRVTSNEQRVKKITFTIPYAM